LSDCGGLCQANPKVMTTSKIGESPRLEEIGIVADKTFHHPNPLVLENGKLDEFELRYETYGKLNENGTNCVLICHALTGDHHAAGYHNDKNQKPGWWHHLIGPGKPIDTNLFFVVCSNCLGACSGSTGPASPFPQSPSETYGMRFPDFTIADMILAQKLLLKSLSVRGIEVVIGGSMGGMQALQWIVDFPDFVKKALVIAATPRHSAQTIAFNEVGRRSILGDPNWENGKYSKESGPNIGLAVARMMAHITYLSDTGMEKKFGRDQQSDSSNAFEFKVESYLDHQGRKFVDRFDANTYLKLTKALDRFDLVGKEGLESTFRDVKSKVLVIAFTSDWLYTPQQNKEIVTALHRLGKVASYLELDHMHGHDSFLINSHEFLRTVRAFMLGMNENELRHQTEDKSGKSPTRYDVKKEADFKVIDDWVNPSEKVLDLGCGTGLLLEYLRDTKNVFGLGVDFDLKKATACVARGVNVYQDDIRKVLSGLKDNSFDWVIFSRMVEELDEPGKVILEALRVGKRVAVSFVNYAYWKNRYHFLKSGVRIRNDVHPDSWESSNLRNYFSVRDFELFCKDANRGDNSFTIGRRVFHRGDWVKTCKFLPNLRAGLAIYELIKN
jgi:homoserine O-acetyltransferase